MGRQFCAIDGALVCQLRLYGSKNKNYLILFLLLIINFFELGKQLYFLEVKRISLVLQIVFLTICILTLLIILGAVATPTPWL